MDRLEAIDRLRHKVSPLRDMETTLNNRALDQAISDMQAIADGQMVELPCKTGDTIYRIFNGEIIEHLVAEVVYRYLMRDFLVEGMPFIRIWWKSVIGKTVFLTKESAQNAPKGEEGKDENGK